MSYSALRNSYLTALDRSFHDLHCQHIKKIWTISNTSVSKVPVVIFSNKMHLNLNLCYILTLKENLHLKMSSIYVVCWIFLQTFQTYFCILANRVDPVQTAPRVWSGSTQFAKMTFKITSRWQGRRPFFVIGSLGVKCKHWAK